MARSVSGGAPPPSRAPEDPFKPLRRKHLRDPPLSGGASATPSGQQPRARPEPARTGRGPALQGAASWDDGQPAAHLTSRTPERSIRHICPVRWAVPGGERGMKRIRRLLWYQPQPRLSGSPRHDDTTACVRDGRRVQRGSAGRHAGVSCLHFRTAWAESLQSRPLGARSPLPGPHPASRDARLRTRHGQIANSH
jgi:hypothetical protein